MALAVRPYHSNDQAACLALFDGNTRFFAPSERADFETFLQAGPDGYFVVEEGRVVACGGVFIKGKVGGLCWGMVERTRHRTGVGGFLLRKRLDYLARTHPQLEAVTLDTSQRSQGFFGRFGFRVVKVTPDGYAPGLDRYDMRLERAALLRLGREDVKPGRREGV